MTPQAFCQPGQSEPFKLAVHAALGTLAGACCLYNVVALLYRREQHLAVNTLLYVAITAIEVVQVKRHLETPLDDTSQA